MKTVVIVGAGQAGSELAVALRQNGFSDRILLVGAEPHLPYQRPPLSKAFLHGKVDQEALRIRALDAYTNAGIEVELDTAAVGIDRRTRSVALADGRTLRYDKLALTTGGSPRPLRFGSGHVAGRTLHHLDDAIALRQELQSGGTLLIVGGGFIGLETAAAAAGMGIAVTLVEAQPRVLARTCPPAVSAFVEREHRRHGVDLRTGVSVRSVTRRDGALLAELSDDTVVRADLILTGVGIAPNDTLAATAGLAAAQGFPSAKPIRLIVGYPPGGGIDFAARTVQVPLQEALKQQLVVDYKPGASGMIAATELTRQPADGYTLLLANTGPFAIAPYLQSKPPYDPIKQFTYIGQISQGSYIAVTRPDHPAKNLKEFVAWAKGQPGKVNFASGGNGTSTHLNGELMNQVTGLDMTHVPYKGSAPAVQDLIGGQTQILIDAGSVLLPQVKGGKLKALAVTGPVRDPQLPDVPTVKELGLAGMESVGFQGLVGPANMPKDVVDRLSNELARALAQPDIKAKFATAGAEVHPLGPAEFAAFVKADNEKWSRLIRERKLQLD